MTTTFTVDIVVTINGRDLVLITRTKPPCMDKLCLPGGRVDPTDIDHAHAAAREACEEINLRVAPGDLRYLTTLDAVWRDERPGRWISTVFHIDLPNPDGLYAGDDAKSLHVFSLASLRPEEIGFDHWEAIKLVRS